MRFPNHTGENWRKSMLGLFLLAAVIPFVQAFLSAGQATFRTRNRAQLLGRYLLTASFHILQPIARLLGRMRRNLTPWRLHGAKGFALPFPRAFSP